MAEPMDAQRLLEDCNALCASMSEQQEEIARELLDNISGKWPLWVLHVLAEADGPLRFSRLAERVEGISQKVLTQTLRQLERNGLLTRTLYPQVPPRVEYALSPLGQELLLQVAPLWRWLAANLPRFEQARDGYGAKPAPAQAMPASAAMVS